MPNERVKCRYCHMTFRILIRDEPKWEKLKCSDCGRQYCCRLIENSRAGYVIVSIKPANIKQWKGEEKDESGCFRG